MNHRKNETIVFGREFFIEISIKRNFQSHQRSTSFCELRTKKRKVEKSFLLTRKKTNFLVQNLFDALNFAEFCFAAFDSFYDRRKVFDLFESAPKNFRIIFNFFKTFSGNFRCDRSNIFAAELNVSGHERSEIFQFPVRECWLLRIFQGELKIKIFSFFHDCRRKNFFKISVDVISFATFPFFWLKIKPKNSNLNFQTKKSDVLSFIVKMN